MLASDPQPLRGDANNDGKVDIDDIKMLSSWLMGKGELTCWQNVDLCEDGVIRGRFFLRAFTNWAECADFKNLCS